MDNFLNQCPPRMSDARLFTDYRTATRREEYVKYINNIVRDDEYRLFLQQKAETIMDNEWNHYRKTKSCWTNQCLYNSPTRVHPSSFTNELKAYNSLKTQETKQKFACEPQNDYRATVTTGTTF
jgi:hypothetical protein